MATKSSGSNIKAVVTLIAIGSICWLAAGVVAIAAGAQSKIIWTCVVGALLGVVGIRYSIRRSRRTGI
jgi:CHASE2 domain-containing sensor protein